MVSPVLPSPISFLDKYTKTPVDYRYSPVSMGRDVWVYGETTPGVSPRSYTFWLLIGFSDSIGLVYSCVNLKRKGVFRLSPTPYRPIREFPF